MKSIARALTAGFLVAIAAGPLAAQGINGSWITEFERQLRNENGEVSAGEKTKARLVLARKGDSVTGTWQILEGSAAPRALKGTISGNRVSLTSQVQARRNINGEESVTTLTVVYDFTVEGDKLQGTSTAKGSDMEMPPRPFTAVREARK
jgi:hypothetical protein